MNQKNKFGKRKLTHGTIKQLNFYVIVWCMISSRCVSSVLIFVSRFGDVSFTLNDIIKDSTSEFSTQFDLEEVMI